jgi:transcription initiation factor TFIID subunit 13
MGSFIIETCHEAAQHASYSRRQKIKVDDFTFALRKDPTKLGRIHELMAMEKDLKKARKVFNEKDDFVPEKTGGNEELGPEFD